MVEVAWKGKGFEGSWAEADVVRVEGTKHALVRFREFVDTDGTPLVEKTPNERLRLPPPSAPVGWHPVLGERIEGEWNDCWWEGVVREFHPLKGVLFQYDRYANWMWLPLHATRPRPPPYLFYPQRDELPEPEVEESSGPRAGICGLQGCQLPNNHLGLCQIRVEGTRRSSMKEKAELQNQEQLWQEIKSRKETRDHVDQARADALKRTEQVGSDRPPPRPGRPAPPPTTPSWSSPPPPPPRRRGRRSRRRGATSRSGTRRSNSTNSWTRCAPSTCSTRWRAAARRSSAACSCSGRGTRAPTCTTCYAPSCRRACSPSAPPPPPPPHIHPPPDAPPLPPRRCSSRRNRASLTRSSRSSTPTASRRRSPSRRRTPRSSHCCPTARCDSSSPPTCRCRRPSSTSRAPPPPPPPRVVGRRRAAARPPRRRPPRPPPPRRPPRPPPPRRRRCAHALFLRCAHAHGLRRFRPRDGARREGGGGEGGGRGAGGGAEDERRDWIGSGWRMAGGWVGEGEGSGDGRGFQGRLGAYGAGLGQ